MTDITMIALSKLVPGQRNVRKTKPAMSVDELAAQTAENFFRLFSKAQPA